MFFIQAVLWFFIILIFYIYFGYPTLLWILTKLKKATINSDLTFEPMVTMFIAAYNEEKVIRNKLLNTVGLSYPKDKLQVIVVSDDSSDRTNDIVKEVAAEYPFIELNIVYGRKGKTEALNKSVTLAKGDILVFSDANSMYKKDAIQHLVKYYVDESIGGVCGELKLVNPTNSTIGESEGVYWKYERLLKTLESQTGTTVVGNGSIYSIRKSLFKPMNPNVGDDMQNPLIMIGQGKRFIYDRDSVTIEETSPSNVEEFGRKVRIVTRSFTGVLSYKRLFNPIKRPELFFKYLSHKLLRYLVPYYMIIIFVLNLFLISQPFYMILFALQILFYLLAYVGRFMKSFVTYIPYYFCIVNLAALIGTYRALTGKRQAVWKPTSR
ncbi:glycosyltransferase family 2 protein [Metabacillus sediminilitoris]|uniref:Glycosyltransferase family 2 protein n=1 Tax=Metabacillus sediminilitoris TaxID=2567941 RepID=A0A4S4C324_9BACI|nr:glycosyltransferase family 2 protein [Metabacillus sediminilitoris]QGQ48158.1 glycosyltransferase [Metabacillus sediminilitoris]THF81479.1 glycosyltransferase family 2 protein [Metabacillus sediminilitoris]